MSCVLRLATASAGPGVGRDLAQHRQQRLHDDGRQAEAQLVDEQQPGPPHHRPGQGQHLLLAPRQQPGPAIEDPLERREPTQQLVERDAATTAGVAEAEVLRRGEIEEQPAVLGDVGHPEPRRR